AGRGDGSGRRGDGSGRRGDGRRRGGRQGAGVHLASDGVDQVMRPLDFFSGRVQGQGDEDCVAELHVLVPLIGGCGLATGRTVGYLWNCVNYPKRCQSWNSSTPPPPCQTWPKGCWWKPRRAAFCSPAAWCHSTTRNS